MILLLASGGGVGFVGLAAFLLNRYDGSREPLPGLSAADQETADLFASMPRPPEIAHDEYLTAPPGTPPIAGRPVVWPGETAPLWNKAPRRGAVLAALVTVRLTQMIVAAERREQAHQAERRRLEAETSRLRSDNATLLLAERQRRQAEDDAQRAEAEARRLAAERERDEAEFPHLFGPAVELGNWDRMSDSAILEAIGAGELPAAVAS